MTQMNVGAVFLLAACVVLAGAASVHAQIDSRVQSQTTQPQSKAPAQQLPKSPFDTDWAKPPGTTGSYIYNDPRLRDPNGPYKPRGSKGCPAPMLYDPAAGHCR